MSTEQTPSVCGTSISACCPQGYPEGHLHPSQQDRSPFPPREGCALPGPGWGPRSAHLWGTHSHPQKGLREVRWKKGPGGSRAAPTRPMFPPGCPPHSRAGLLGSRHPLLTSQPGPGARAHISCLAGAWTPGSASCGAGACCPTSLTGEGSGEQPAQGVALRKSTCVWHWWSRAWLGPTLSPGPTNRREGARATQGPSCNSKGVKGS